MNLTKDNIEKWKISITKKMKKRFDVDDFGETQSNEEWLKSHEGYSENEAIEEEISYWEE